MEPRAAVLKVVVVIGDQVRIDAVAAKHVRERMVERLKRPPAAMEKIQAPRLDVASSRHAGQTAHEVPIEHNRARSESVEVRRSRRSRLVAGQRMPVQRIEQEENDFHDNPEVLGRSYIFCGVSGRTR